jgi:uncharacterized glyoxalase superfamily protein PhnB
MKGTKVTKVAKAVKVKKVTPIVIVDAIEPALEFWCAGLGFERVAEVPHEGRLGFVLLARAGHELMLQTRASVMADVPAALEGGATHALYVDVDSLDDAVAAVAGAKVVVPRRRTFYGADEVWGRDPSDTLVGFAEHAG